MNPEIRAPCLAGCTKTTKIIIGFPHLKKRAQRESKMLKNKGTSGTLHLVGLSDSFEYFTWKKRFKEKSSLVPYYFIKKLKYKQRKMSYHGRELVA